MSIRKRRARRHSRTHIVGFGAAGIFGFIALLIGAVAISLGALVSSWLQDLPDYTSADAYLVAEPTTVYASDGTTIAEYYLQNRRSVDLDQISDYVLKGIVDTEDVRFYKHNGVDPQGILRAVAVQLTGGSEGASTITQQLVRNTVLSDEQFDKTLKRKVREAYIAIQMEKTYTKDQILNMYLNTIYFGHSAYGIEAASVTYFDKHAKDLSLAEAATLCGLPQSPSGYDPLQNPEAAKKRRNTVLDRMLAAGDITQEEHDKACAEDLKTKEGSFTEAKTSYPYFADYVKQLLLEDFDSDTIMQGGLEVYTTIDPKTQAAAEDAVKKRLDEIGDNDLQQALVAVDPSTGYIKALVGGRDYNANQYDLATQAKRQPGSSFKIFTLSAALANGMSPNTMVDCNSPMQFSATWRVQNFGNESMGTISLKDAFARSSNTGFVQVIQAIGASKVVSMAKDLGIDVDLPAYDSITLGTEGIPVVEMAEAYATMATNGVHRDAIAITKIEDRNGNTVYEHKDDPKQVLEEPVAQDVRSCMEQVVKTGTAASLGSYLTVNQPVAGKTGTSENYRDLWFCGITPQLAVAVWTGYEQEGPVYVGGTYGHPYNTSVMTFAYFLNEALKDSPRKEFPTTDKNATYKQTGYWTLNGPIYGTNKSYTNDNYDKDVTSPVTDDENEDTNTTVTVTTTTTTGQTQQQNNQQQNNQQQNNQQPTTPTTTPTEQPVTPPDTNQQQQTPTEPTTTQ